MGKLQDLADSCGMTVDELLESAALDEIVPGICTTPLCDYSTDVEPDQRTGWCESCGTNTVKSCLVLAGLIRTK